jgi:hypothetical protein
MHYLVYLFPDPFASCTSCRCDARAAEISAFAVGGRDGMVAAFLSTRVVVGQLVCFTRVVMPGGGVDEVSGDALVVVEGGEVSGEALVGVVICVEGVGGGVGSSVDSGVERGTWVVVFEGAVGVVGSASVGIEVEIVEGIELEVGVVAGVEEGVGAETAAGEGVVDLTLVEDFEETVTNKSSLSLAAFSIAEVGARVFRLNSQVNFIVNTLIL